VKTLLLDWFAVVGVFHSFPSQVSQIPPISLVVFSYEQQSASKLQTDQQKDTLNTVTLTLQANDRKPIDTKIQNRVNTVTTKELKIIHTSQPSVSRPLIPVVS